MNTKKTMNAPSAKETQHKVTPLSQQEQKNVAGGYAPTKPVILIPTDGSDIPDIKIPTEEDFRCY